jgi:hypothetical protein
MPELVSTLDELSLLFDTIANQAFEENSQDSLGSGVLNKALNWLAKKQATYTGDAYFEQLEKNAVYFRESALVCNGATATYLHDGTPILQTEEQVTSFVLSQREFGRAVTLLQLQFLRSGCDGCEIHSWHGKWANFKQLRSQPNRSAYLEELEFASIYFHSMFTASQYFLTIFLQNHNLARICQLLNPKDVGPTTEQRVELWTSFWIGLTIFPKVTWDKNNVPSFAPLEVPSKRRAWREIWGEEYERITGGGDHQVLERVQKLKLQGDIPGAAAMLESYLSTHAKDTTHSNELAGLTKTLAHLYYIQHDLKHAKNYYSRAVESYVELGNERYAGLCMMHLGTCADSFARSKYYAQQVQSLQVGERFTLPPEVMEQAAQEGVKLFNERDADSNNAQGSPTDQANREQKKSWWRFGK